MKRAFVIALLLGLPLGVLVQRLAARPLEWQRWQERWRELRRSRGLPDRAPGLVTTGETGERCPSCHLGALPGLSVGGHPLFAPHPRLDCDRQPARGCSGCHRGDPRRLDADGAHGLRGPAGQRLLALGLRGESRRRFLQAGCSGCHRRAGPVLSLDEHVVPEAAAGLALFVGQACAACHRLPGVAASAEVGPPLAPVAWWRGVEELRERLLRPQAFAPASPMPPLELPREQQDRLLVFLTAQASPVSPAAGATPRLLDHLPADYPPEPTPAAGALWARRLGCAGCHRLGEEAAGVPDLRYVGWYARGEELRTMLVDPRRRVPGTWMPRAEVPAPVLESLLAWLALQRRPLPPEPGQVARQLCARCHGRAPDPKRVVLSRRPPLLEGVHLDEARFLEAASGGRPGTAMAPWGRVLSRSFLLELRTALEGAR